MITNLPAVQETLVRPLGREDLLEEEMATHSSILPGESHGQRSLTGYSPWGRKESDTTERLSLSLSLLGKGLTPCLSPALSLMPTPSWGPGHTSSGPVLPRGRPGGDACAPGRPHRHCCLEERAGHPGKLQGAFLGARRHRADSGPGHRGVTRQARSHPASALRCVQRGASLHSDFCSAACELCSLRQTVPPL